MGHIKEPKGIDFVINSEPLTDIARKEISDFIVRYKNESLIKKAKTRIITEHKRAKIVHT